MGFRLVILLFSLVVDARAGSAPPALQKLLETCFQGIDEKRQLILSNPEFKNTKRSVAGKRVTTFPKADQLLFLKSVMEWVPPKRQALQESFERTLKNDPRLQELLAVLKQMKVDFHFYDMEKPGLCRGAQLAYFTPGPLRREVGMCALRGDLFVRYRVAFIHEALHALQFARSDLRAMLTFQLGNRAHFGKNTATYTPDPKYLEWDELFAAQGHQRVGTLPPAIQDQAFYLLEAFDQIKTLFLIYPAGGGLAFVPKKPWVIPDKQFYDDLERAFRIKPDPFDSPFSVSIGGFAVPDPEKVEGVEPLELLSNHWHQWLKANPKLQRYSRKEQTEKYKKFLERKYQTLLAALEPAPRASLTELFHLFFATNRIIRGLLNYCLEMQANMQSQLLLYVVQTQLREVRGCEAITLSDLKVPLDRQVEEDVFAPTYRHPANFDRVEQDLEKYVKKFLSRTQSYGQTFSFLYGYSRFPHLFNPGNCQTFQKRFINYRP